MDEAWRLVKGMKASFWGAAIVIGLIYLVVGAIMRRDLRAVFSKTPNAIVKHVFNGARRRA